MKNEQLVDCEGITLESAKPFAFSCCDCGLTHHMIIVSEDGRPVGFAVKRITPAPEQATPQDAAPAVAVEATQATVERALWTIKEWALLHLGGWHNITIAANSAHALVAATPSVVQPTPGQDAEPDSVHLDSGASGGVHAQLSRVFDDGWRLCTKWANRDDLLADMGSKPYTEGREICIAAILSSEKAQAGGRGS